ncbi:MAG TPA: 16S rRNA (guanine(527)-N(7))-methyltransferase RsmG [Gammaproteobacteria bacterium]|nr:16S rRNA (guanine(527)-N(7))-methyltransferase RsmG [Gammaproteobacteria bacterium]
MPPDTADRIAAGAAGLGVTLPPAAVDALAAYLALLHKWNRAYNLTAVRDPRDMVVRHVLDSLALLPFLRGTRLLDVGTGAGLPGLVLAVARPELAVTLLDSSAKKLRFVRQAAAELGLANTGVVQARMQEYRPEQSFDMVVSRAVASLKDLYLQSRHLLAPGGRMLFMKGALPETEIGELPGDWGRPHVETLHIPGLKAQRHLLWLEKPHP